MKESGVVCKKKESISNFSFAFFDFLFDYSC